MTEKLENILGYTFKNKNLLKQALTHSSVTSHVGSNYERLEFLGDRVLGVAVAAALFKTFPQEPEGSLSQRHTRLVCKETVSAMAKTLHMDKYMTVANEEIRDNENVLCDVCEAVIGAIYIDSGCEEALNFVTKNWQPLLHKDLTPPKDFKTRLQELSHAHGNKIPEYNLVSRSGSEHEPTFIMSVTVAPFSPVIGEGHNKKQAEQNAAARMIKILEQHYGKK